MRDPRSPYGGAHQPRLPGLLTLNPAVGSIQCCSGSGGGSRILRRGKRRLPLAVKPHPPPLDAGEAPRSKKFQGSLDVPSPSPICSSLRGRPAWNLDYVYVQTVIHSKAAKVPGLPLVICHLPRSLVAGGNYLGAQMVKWAKWIAQCDVFR